MPEQDRLMFLFHWLIMFITVQYVQHESDTSNIPAFNDKYYVWSEAWFVKYIVNS